MIICTKIMAALTFGMPDRPYFRCSQGSKLKKTSLDLKSIYSFRNYINLIPLGNGKLRKSVQNGAHRIGAVR